MLDGTWTPCSGMMSIFFTHFATTVEFGLTTDISEISRKINLCGQRMSTKQNSEIWIKETCYEFGESVMKKMFPEEIKQHKQQIDQMSQVEMARLWRSAPFGHMYFDMSLPFFDYFEARFKELGGMTSEISKQIGW